MQKTQKNFKMQKTQKNYKSKKPKKKLTYSIKSKKSNKMVITGNHPFPNGHGQKRIQTHCQVFGLFHIFIVVFIRSLKLKLKLGS